MATDGPVSSFPIDKEEAEEEIALLVRKPGFDELTPSDIVRHMNNRFNINFDSYKSQLKKMVINQIKKRNDEDSSDSSGGESGSESDEEKAETSQDSKRGSKKKTKTEAKEEIKKEENTSKTEPDSDSDSDSGVDDAEAAPKKKKAKTPIIPADMLKSSRRAAASEAMKQIRYTSAGGNRYAGKSKKVKDPNEDNYGKFGPMTKLCYISPELQQVTGDQWMKRCDVVKSIWDYIKEKNLKDPKNGQFVLCDDVLNSIFKKTRIKAFGMAKFLHKHIVGTNDMAPDMREEAEQEMAKRKEEWLERKRKRAEESAISDDDDKDDDDGPETKKSKKEEEELC